MFYKSTYVNINFEKNIYINFNSERDVSIYIYIYFKKNYDGVIQVIKIRDHMDDEKLYEGQGFGV